MKRNKVTGVTARRQMYSKETVSRKVMEKQQMLEQVKHGCTFKAFDTREQGKEMHEPMTGRAGGVNR